MKSKLYLSERHKELGTWCWKRTSSWWSNVFTHSLQNSYIHSCQVFLLSEHHGSLIHFKSRNEREARLSSYFPLSFFWCNSSTADVRCLPLKVLHYGTSVLQSAAGWWVTFLRFLLATVSTCCQCFCSSCGPEPTTRGQQESSNDVLSSAPGSTPSGGLFEVTQHVTRIGWADGLFKRNRNIHHLLLTPVHACLWAAGVTLEKTRTNMSHTHTHTLLLKPHTIFTLRKERKKESTTVQMNYAAFNFFRLSLLINSLWINYVPWSFVLNQS